MSKEKLPRYGCETEETHYVPVCKRCKIWSNLLDKEYADHTKEVADLRKQVYEIKKVYNALSGPRAHQLGCDCGGKNRSGYTCKQFYDLMKKD